MKFLENHDSTSEHAPLIVYNFVTTTLEDCVEEVDGKTRLNTMFSEGIERFHDR